MKRKIFASIFITSLLCIVAAVLLVISVFYSNYYQKMKQEVEDEAYYFKNSVETSGVDVLENIFWPGNISSLGRVTLISENGDVLFDSYTEASSLENHLDRPEVQEALEYGAGEDERESETASKSAYYYALRLENGDVLRISMDMNSRFDLFRSALPVIVICCIAVAVLAALLSLLFTRQLVRPIVRMGSRLDEIDREVPYPEMQPFVDAIVHDRAIRRENENMRQEFTANVSHELKTPLTSISGYAELIETGIAKPEDVQNFARKIHKEAGRLLHLVNDIIQLSRLDAAQEARQIQEFELLDLKELISLCAENLSVNAQRAYVTLLCEGERTVILGSRASIEELCINLTDNAIRYNRPGGKVILSCGTAEGRPYLRVRDNGIGIPAEDQERVFERFYRVDKSRSKETGGTGLGLAIVKHIAAVHGAQIELKSEEGRGTDIRISFKPVNHKK